MLRILAAGAKAGGPRGAARDEVLHRRSIRARIQGQHLHRRAWLLEPPQVPGWPYRPRDPGQGRQASGQAGVSQTENIPSVAAQPTLFTQWQLVFYRIGRIKNEMMGPIAAELSDDDVRELGAYLSTLPPPKPADQPDDAPALTEAGKQLVQGNHCDNCHGATLTGQEAAARLAGQREEYLLKALHDYKAG